MSISIIHIISSLQRGGRERQLSVIYKYTDSNKVKTKIICFKKAENSYTSEVDFSNDIIYLQAEGLVSKILEVRKICIENKASILWSWGGIEATVALLVALTSPVKHINGSIRHGIFKLKFHQIWRLLILHLSKYIVANSKAGLKVNFLNRGKVLYNGIDDKFFMQNNVKNTNVGELKFESDGLILVSVANLVPYKDYESVFKALYKIKLDAVFKFTYLIIGDGPMRNYLEELIRDLNLQNEVSLLGGQTNVKAILDSSDLFIHSSIGEGCSNAILEAMACGLPIVASDTGGTSEIIDQTNGRLFEYKNHTQLAAVIIELVKNEPLRMELAKNSRLSAINKFSVEQMIIQYCKIINNVLDEKIYR